jgi:hypothetical protein
MADSKITALTALTAADPVNDMFPVVDVSDTSMAASGTTKRISVNNLLSSSPTASGALTVTGLVTAGSATITGDLTVDTSTLKVDSTNNRVGIGTATPTAELHVIGGANFSDGTTTLRAVSAGNVAFLGTTTADPLVLRVNSAEQYRIAASGVFTWADGAGGTRMTLNSTGLGVFNSPVAALDVYKVANDTINRTNATFCFGQMAGLGAGLLGQQSLSAPYQFNLQAANAANSVQFPLVLQPSGGNVGVGTALSGGSISNTAKILAGIFSTLIGTTGSIATATPTTMFAAPSESTLMVTAYITGSSAPANYNAVSIVKVSGGTAAITAISTALNLTITLSGADVQVTQTSGVNQAIQFNVLRLA